MACSLLGSTVLLLLFCVLCTEQKKTPPGCQNTSPPNGFFTEQRNEFPLNEKVNYRCQSGYTTPNGLQEGETRCLETGWSPEPKCIKTCQKPSEENAIFNKIQSFYLFKETLHYECKEGFQTMEETIDAHVQCTENGWDPNPLCLPIECEAPVLEHGNIHPRKDKYVNRDVVKFSCMRGFTRVGPDSAQCYHFGWSPQLPTCKDKVNSCQAPPSISNGTLIGDLLEEYQHGGKVFYECDIRFAMSGSNSVECVDGEWTSLPSCTEEVKTCGPPPHITNGYAVTVESRKYWHNESVQYECRKDFFVVGMNPAKCLHGEWKVPECTKKCKRPKDTKFVPEVPLSKQFNNNVIVMYSCGSSQRVTQCVNGKWSPKPECEDLCPPPPQLPNAISIKEVRNYKNDEEVSFSCVEHFLLQGPQIISCEYGRWQTPPRCVVPPHLDEKTCTEPPVVDHADIVEDRAEVYLPGHELRYECYEGFEISGSNTIRCEHNTWSESPTCEDVRCPPPPIIPHGRINGRRKEKYLPHEKVSYRCLQGYSLFGSPVVTCSNKQWTEAPQCREATGKCDHAPSIENGDIREIPQAEYNSGDIVHYKCQAYHRMEGNPEVRCLNGHWTETPRCLVPCTASEEDMQRNNINLRWLTKEKLYSESGDVTEFVCRQGYRPAPSSPPFRVQCRDGTFEYPQCI